VLDAVLAGVRDDLVVPLRERLERGVEQAEGDPGEAAALLRAAYREWKTQRVDEIAAHLAVTAYGWGAFAALDPGASVCWAVDRTATPCADADDNALAGEVKAGEPFPTGHLFPPAHPGCRCLLTRQRR
jgi:hypothetical protein